MSVYKPFITSDVIVSPFKVNKSFTFKGNELTDLNIEIDRYIGRNITSSLWVSGSYPTGQITPQDEILVYRSIKELYYSNYLTNPSGSPAGTASFNTDGTITGPAYTTNYYNYLSTTLPTYRYIPTESNATIGVISIPSNLFGEYLNPGTVSISSGSITITDDGLGNMISGSLKFGDVIYEHGIIILTSNGVVGFDDGYGYITYGSGLYGGATFNFINSFINSNITCSFQSTTTIYETQYKCTIRQNEFNFSQNPTLLGPPDQGYDINYYDDVLIYEDDAVYDGYDFSALNSNIYPWATGSYFNPYITTVGLYNNNKELLAVAKLSQPLPLSSVTDTTILVNLDL
jgi:hypothetical protein